jgi:hypothetical protein
MPDKKNLNLVLGSNVADIKQARLPGLDRPFEKLTVSELVQLRPGSDVADSYGFNAVTDNISVSSSPLLEELGQIQKVRAMQKVTHQARLDELRSASVTPRLPTRSSALSVAPRGLTSVALPSPEEEVFSNAERGPFKA